MKRRFVVVLSAIFILWATQKIERIIDRYENAAEWWNEHFPSGGGSAGAH